MLSSTSTIIIYYCTWPKSCKSWQSFYHPVEGWLDLGTAVKGHNQRLHVTVAVMINTKHNCLLWDSIMESLTLQSFRLLLAHWNLQMCLSLLSIPVNDISISNKPHVQISPNFLIVTGGRGLVLLWWQCDMLCTSGFVDDVMFSQMRANEQNQRRCTCFLMFNR